MKNKLLQVSFLLVFQGIGMLTTAQQIRVVDNKGSILQVDPSKWAISTNSVDIYNKNMTNSGNVGVGTKTPTATLHNAGSTILGMTTATNSSATYTVPTASVDGFSGVVITQSASACALTVAPPTSATEGRRFTIANASGSAFPLTVGTYTILSGNSADLVWDGGAWSIPSSIASAVPFSGLTNATAINTEDNTNFEQTWNWSTATTQNPLSINANALTSGTLLGLNANALAGGTGLSVASTGAATTGNLLSVTSASAGAFSAGGARFNFTGDHTGSGFQIDDVTTAGTAAAINANALAGGTGLSIASTGTTTTGNLLSVTSASTSEFTNGGARFNFTGDHAGSGFQVDDVTTAGTAAAINANALAGGTGLSVASIGTATTGNLLSVTSASAGAFSAGGARFNFTGAHTGSGFQIDDVTTAGTAAAINANALTGGTGLSVVSTGAATTGNLLSVTSASAGAFSAGGARFNFTGAHTGSGFQIDDVTTAGTAAAINANALAGGTGLSVASTGTATTGNLLSVTSASTSGFTNGGARFNFTGDHTGSGFQIDDVTTTGTAAAINANALTTGTAFSINVNSLTNGRGLSISSTSPSMTSGNLLSVNSSSTYFGAAGVKFNFSGAHSGIGFDVASSTLTGTPVRIFANSLTSGTGLSIVSSAITTGSALSITSSSTANTSTTGLLSVANTTATTTGTVFRAQSNSTAGSGLYVLANGNVGIGKAAPTVALDVTGGANFSGDVVISGIASFPSDIRLKTKIETLTSVLSKIEQLRGVRYEFINQQKYAKGPQVGVIAQELQKVFPELVKKGTDGYLSVNYSQLTGVLIQAVKEQQKEIDLLKKQMEKVMNKLGIVD